MIKGKQKEKLNQFKLELELLLGSHHDQFGLIYYFELLHETFTRAVKHLKYDSQKFKNELIYEDSENIPSLIQSYESVFNPCIDTLYNSYFITVHSELEIILSKVNEIVQRFYNNSTFPKKATNSYFNSFNDESKTLVFIKDTLTKHEILIIYNYVRNGITHSKNNKNCPLFIELEEHVNSGKINFLDIIENEKGMDFLIKDIDFIVNYSQEVISFFQDLISNSKNLEN